MLGKVVTDLQSSVSVGESAITGTLKYVTGYTGFSSDTAEQNGNYLALKATSEIADSIVCGYNSQTMTLGSDGIVVVRITDKTKPLTFTAKKTGYADYTRSFSLSGLTLEEAT